MARAPIVQDIEAPPEADRLDGFAHPRASGRTFGHEDAEMAFAQAFDAGRVHHAWLITGREGIGKATFAYNLARYVLAKPAERGAGGAGPLSVPGQSVAARQVLALSHPGLMLIRRPWDPKGKRHLSAITVDEVRRLKSFLAHSAAPDAWRVVIVDQADELNVNAANALLKSLEEPPARALFLLISSQPGRLLTTIRSRCRRLNLHPLEDGALRQAAATALEAAGHEPIGDADWAGLISMAHGSVRRLLALSRAGGPKLTAKVTAMMSLLPKVDWPAVHALADDITGAGSEQSFEQAFELILDRMARLIRARATLAGSAEEQAAAARLIPEGALATWAELWETTLARKAEAVALNLDRKSLILETVARLQAASRD